MTKSTKTNHYTYIIRHINGRYYIGRRSTKKDPLIDTYMGSGNWVRGIKDRSTLTKEIIAYYPNTEELKVAEFELIEKYFLDEYCMNAAYSSCGYVAGQNSGKNNPMFGVRLIGDKNHMYGRKHTEETKLKISENRIGKHVGAEHHSFGKIVTKETRAKLSATKMGKYIGSNHPRSKLTDSLVCAIKSKLLSHIDRGVLAIEYNVNRSTIDRIANGSTWGHISI